MKTSFEKKNRRGNWENSSFESGAKRYAESSKSYSVHSSAKRRNIANKAVSVFMAALLCFWAVPANAFATTQDAEQQKQSQEATETTHNQSDDASSGKTAEDKQGKPEVKTDAQQPKDDGEKVIEEGSSSSNASAEKKDGTQNDAQPKPSTEAADKSNQQSEGQPVKKDDSTNQVKDEPKQTDNAEADQKENTTESATVKKITIRFDANMPAAEAAADSRAMNDVEVALDGKDASLPANTIKREGYAFVGWATTADGFGDSGSDSPAVIADGQSATDLAYTLQATHVEYANGTNRIVPQAVWDNHATDFEAAAADGATIAGTSKVSETYDLKPLAKDDGITLYAQWVKLAPAAPKKDAIPESAPDQDSPAKEEADVVQPSKNEVSNSEPGDSETVPAEGFPSQLRSKLSVLPQSNASLAMGSSPLLKSTGVFDGLLQVNVEGFDSLPKDGDVFLYDFRNKDHVEQKIELEFGQGMFDGGWRTVRVQLPTYGFAFVDTLASDLESHAEVRNAKFTKQNGYNTILTFELYGDADTTRHVDLQTKMVTLSNAQCAKIISDGWVDQSLDVTVSDGSAVLAKNVKYTLRPKADDYTGIITIPEHSWDVVTEARFANWQNGRGDYGPSFYGKDVLYIKMKVAGGDEGVGLMKLGQFKVYVPDERLILSRADAGGVYGPDRIVNHFNWSGPHTDGAKGTYYLFTPKPGAAMYNMPTVSGAETRSVGVVLYWRIKDVDDQGNPIRFLDSDPEKTLYKANDLDIEFVKDANVSASVSPVDSGSSFYTLPVDKSNNYGFVENSNSGVGYSYYKRTYDASVGSYRSNTKVTPDSFYTSAVFVPLKQAASAKSGIEYRGPEHVTELYEFPYEVQPSRITWRVFNPSYPNGVCEIAELKCTVVDSGTGAIKRTEIFTGPMTHEDSIDLSSKLQEGERISQAEIEWSCIWAPTESCYAATLFDYYVPLTHSDGVTPIVSDELLHVGYVAEFDDPDFDKRAFSTEAGGEDEYLYLQVVDKDCPWLVDVKKSDPEQDWLKADLSSGADVLISEYLALKGKEGLTRRYMDDPRIELDVSASGDIGLQTDKGVVFLSGDMVLTKNLSEWVIDYSVCDENGENARSGSYSIPQLDGDMHLTRSIMGVSDNERFTSFILRYAGRCQFEEIEIVPQAGRSGDGSLSGTYEYITLLRNIKVRMIEKGLSGEHLHNGKLTFKANVKHDGNCNRSGHEEGEASKNDGSIYQYSVTSVRGDYTYSMKAEPSAAAKEASVVQGGTILADVFSNLTYRDTNSGATTNKSRRVPYAGVPEAIYIEIVDDHCEPDLSNQDFLSSLNAHGMTSDNVSVIKRDGKRWLKLAQNPNDTMAWAKGAYNFDPLGGGSKGGTKENVFTIALRVWDGHELGETAPLGEVYYDLSQYPVKYDGGESSEWRTMTLLETVADTHGLLGDGDTTTARLWKADASDLKIDVQKNTSTGATVYPGKHGFVEYSGTVDYLKSEHDNLLADLTVNSPSTATTSYDYEVILQIPRAGETYSWSQQGVQNTVTSDADLYMGGPAVVSKSTLGSNSQVTFTYSTDGSSFVGEGSVGSWENVRFVKVHVNEIDPFKSFAVRLPVKSGAADDGASHLSNIGGTWSFRVTQSSSPTTPATMRPAQYVSAPTVAFSVTKQLKAPAELSQDGTHNHLYPFAQDAFKFTVTPLANAPMPDGDKVIEAGVSKAEVTTGSDGKQTQEGGIAAFSGFEFDVPGTYKYEIREVIPDDATQVTDDQGHTVYEKDGVVYDESTRTVTVTIKRAADGKLSATVSPAAESLVFTNRYEVEDADLVFGGTKVLVANGATAQHVSGYSFLLEEQRGDNWVHRYDAAVNDDGTFSFTPLEFTQLDLDEGAVFKYRIHEVIPADAETVNGKKMKAGVTYDQSVYEATVTLVDNGDGTMTPSAKYVKVVNAEGATVSEEANSVAFSNSYECTGKATLHATKNLAGRDWADDDAFTFNLEGKGILNGTTVKPGDVPMPAGPATAQATKQVHTASFGEIAFTYANIGKTYVYEMSEAVPATPEENMAYSQDKYRVSITPKKDNGDGTIDIEVKYEEIVEGEGGTQTLLPVHGVPAFLNKSIGHGTANIFVEKDLEGRDWTVYDEFTFVLEADHVEDSGGNSVNMVVPMPSSNEASATMSDESAEFGTIQYEYDKDHSGKTFYYKVTEKLPSGASGRVKDGITYSDAERKVRVKVHPLSDTDIRLTADVEYEVSDGVWTKSPVSYFKNTYSTSPVTVSTIQARKLLKAPADLNEDHSYDWAYEFDEGAFSFRLTPSVNELGETAPMPLGDDDKPLESLIAEVTAGNVENGQAVEGTGIATFSGEITFEKVGSYVYTINEVIPDDAENASGVKYAARTSTNPAAEGPWAKDGVTYTEAAHNVFVEVTDNGLGELEAEVSYMGANGEHTSTPHEFTNLYHTSDVNLTLSGAKTINEALPGAGYTFSLTRMADEDSHRAVDTAVRYASSDESGTFTFPELVFPQWRLGKTTTYVVAEVVPDDAVNASGTRYTDASDTEKAAGGFELNGVKYDASAYEVLVTVNDEGKGQASTSTSIKKTRDFHGNAVSEDVEAISFDNIIDPAGEFELMIQKELRGREWLEGDQFAFAIENVSADGLEAPMPESANVVATAQNHEDNISFGTIGVDHEQVGKTLTYKITEQTGSAEGITYDNTEYYAVIESSPVGDGTANVQVTYYKGSIAEGNQVDVPQFVNYYGLEPCKHDPPIRKIVEGSPSEPGSFSFEMRPNDSSYPMMEGTVDGVKTVVQTGPGAVEFGEITFTHPGVYDYTVREVAGESSEYSYDASTWTVRYTVTEQDMSLHADRVFLKDGQPVDAQEATFTNVYTATSPGPKPDPEPEPSPDPVPDPDPSGKANVVVTKAADKQFVKTGDQVTYTITVANKGDVPGKGVYVKDYVPAGMTYVSCDGAGAKYGSTIDGRAFVTWWVESLAPGKSETLTMVVRVNECRAGDKFENVALWSEPPDGERPSPSTDPGENAGGKTSNKVTIVAQASNELGKTQQTKKSTSSSSGKPKSKLPTTGDNLHVAALVLIALLAAAGTTLVVARRRS